MYHIVYVNDSATAARGYSVWIGKPKTEPHLLELSDDPWGFAHKVQATGKVLYPKEQCGIFRAKNAILMRFMAVLGLLAECRKKLFFACVSIEQTVIQNGARRMGEPCLSVIVGYRNASSIRQAVDTNFTLRKLKNYRIL
jgi:hypothetical protein